MRTIVIARGTDGIGAALSRHYLDAGEAVVVIGRNAAKGAAFMRSAPDGRAFFVRADLGSIAENRRVVAEIRAGFATVDALVHRARHYRSVRHVTGEGLEENFALFYLSRYLLEQGLLDRLQKAEHPVIVNVAGPGSSFGVVRWDDLQLARGYHGGAALWDTAES